MTDGASYCLSIGKELKLIYPDLKHIVCICHNLHLLAEEVRKLNPFTNTFVAKLKSVTIKNKSNQMIYRETTGLHFLDTLE